MVSELDWTECLSTIWFSVLCLTLKKLTFFFVLITYLVDIVLTL